MSSRAVHRLLQGDRPTSKTRSPPFPRREAVGGGGAPPAAEDELTRALSQICASRDRNEQVTELLLLSSFICLTHYLCCVVLHLVSAMQLPAAAAAATNLLQSVALLVGQTCSNNSSRLGQHYELNSPQWKNPKKMKRNEPPLEAQQEVHHHQVDQLAGGQKGQSSSLASLSLCPDPLRAPTGCGMSAANIAICLVF